MNISLKISCRSIICLIVCLLACLFVCLLAGLFIFYWNNTSVIYSHISNRIIVYNWFHVIYKNETSLITFHIIDIWIIIHNFIKTRCDIIPSSIDNLNDDILICLSISHLVFQINYSIFILRFHLHSIRNYHNHNHNHRHNHHNDVEMCCLIHLHN